MKLFHKLFFIVFFVFHNSLFSQHKLCRENTPMWSECFKLDSNGTFKYRLFMCDPTEYGNGTYKISKNFLTLKFDSIQMLKIDKRFNDSIKTKVSIKITDIVYEKPRYLIKIKYKNDSFYTDINGMFIRNYTGGLIEIYLEEKLIINPSKDKSNEYNIEYISRFFRYTKQGKKIRFKKKGTKYYTTEKRYLFKKHKIWFGKRKVFYIFR